ncbi:bifunctional diguanylate cyclase/phosphodiesterase [Thermanaeromonas sp.]|uniref:bifunctional diguanylate cyclase/phosphodiesterase n=1 Tax=Thermanaeromonas sp. TaxID=2003697 RepID=UPI002636893B|nr:bifunctional diguanylate cyclase/phosphodiesterase [Thermanaeromonas sp.]
MSRIMLSKDFFAELLGIIQGKYEATFLSPELSSNLKFLLHRMQQSVRDISHFLDACQQAVEIGRLFYGHEIPTEQVLRELVALADTFIRDYLHTQDLPAGGQKLKEILVGAILELGCVSLGYQDEALRVLKILSETDPLTGLLSREHFQKELDTALEYAKHHNENLNVIWADVDDLKLVNDLYGYAVGDAVLRVVAEVLREVFAPVNGILARTGSNSFGVIVPAKDMYEILALAESFRQAVEQQRPIEEDFGVTVSIGISCYPVHGMAANDLLAAAEMATLKAKRLGKNRIVVLDVNAGTTDLTVVHEKSLILREALQKPEGVIPYFQPIVDVETGNVIGYEILARIQYQGRVLPAAAFAELAEDINMIHSLTEKSLEKALWKISQKDSEHLIFVNCALQEVERDDLVEKFLRMLKDYGIRPDRLVVELTERQAVRDVGKVHIFATHLQNAGMRLALDDFGSGFSSFLYLRQFDCYFVKIEGSLIRDITRSARCKLIVEHIAALLRSLAIEPIAEWVETAEACAILKRFGVNLCQGYYLGKPSPEILD